MGVASPSRAQTPSTCFIHRMQDQDGKYSGQTVGNAQLEDLDHALIGTARLALVLLRHGGDVAARVQRGNLAPSGAGIARSPL